jgi:tetratricopeptide (TPR) repeat protein
MRLLAAVMALSSAALAQTSSNDQEAAKAHFLAGSAYYDQADYTGAVREFNEAYRLSQRPDLLYNIALAYERLERWDDAIGALRHYLRDKPDAPDRETIAGRIETLEKRRDAVQPSPVAVPLVTTAPRPRHVASFVVGGIGLGALAASIGTGATALSFKSDLDAACRNQRCPPSAQDKIDTGGRLAIATDVLIAVGAVAVVVGIVLYVAEGRTHRR